MQGKKTKENRPTRRETLRYIFGGSLLAVVVAAIYAAVHSLLSEEDDGTQEGIAARVGELVPNSSLNFKFGRLPVLLIMTEDGQYRAFSARCTHRGCVVRYLPDMHQIYCPCHSGFFDVSGRVLSGPPPKPLLAFAVEIQNGEIIVRRQPSS